MLEALQQYSGVLVVAAFLAIMLLMHAGHRGHGGHGGSDARRPNRASDPMPAPVKAAADETAGAEPNMQGDNLGPANARYPDTTSNTSRRQDG